MLDGIERDLLGDLQAVLAASQAGQIGDRELQDALHDVQLAVDDLRARQSALPAGLGPYLAHLDALSTGPQLDVKHKLVAELPIIPFVLSYQGEFELEDGLRLAELWRRVVAKVRGRR